MKENHEVEAIVLSAVREADIPVEMQTHGFFEVAIERVRNGQSQLEIRTAMIEAKVQVLAQSQKEVIGKVHSLESMFREQSIHLEYQRQATAELKGQQSITQQQLFTNVQSQAQRNHDGRWWMGGHTLVAISAIVGMLIGATYFSQVVVIPTYPNTQPVRNDQPRPHY